jgi:hypothetical protein
MSAAKPRFNQQKEEQVMKILIMSTLFLSIAIITGCTTGPEPIRAADLSARGDVFEEVTDRGPIPQGYAVLRIVSSLKTHKPGIYRSENRSEKKTHGTPDYKLIVNIDGQVTEMTGTLQDENIEPRGLRDPEAGDGVRYFFRKDLRLKVGTHKIVIAIPEDKITIDRKLTLGEGSVNDLVLAPNYGSTAPTGRPTYYSPTSFLSGIKGFSPTLNGKPL